MQPDVVDFSAFYDTRLGLAARRLIRRAVRGLWPDLHALSLLGLGYATPYLRPFREEAGRVIALMPSSLGVLPWPRDAPRLVGLAEADDLPLPDESIDRVLLVHALEFSEQADALLREVRRVMTGEGRLLVIVPNRAGLWARLERTPYGHGRPFSPSQLSRLLCDNLFTPTETRAALYMPPSDKPVLLRAAGAWERFGRRWGRPFGGVILIEAAKRVYAPRPERMPLRLRHRVFIPMPGSGVPANPRVVPLPGGGESR